MRRDDDPNLSETLNDPTEPVTTNVESLLDTLRRLGHVDAPQGDLHQVMELLGDAIYVLDREGRIQYINRAHERLSGYDRQQLLDSPAASFMSPESIRRAKDAIKQLLADPNRSHTSFEFEAERPDGTRRVYEDKLTVLTDQEGNYQGSVGVVRDVTEKARFEQKRELDRASLRQLYELAGSSDLALSDKLVSLLNIGCHRLDLPIGFLTKIVDGEQHIRAAVGDHSQLQTGQAVPLEESYCRKTIEREDLVAYYDAGAQGWRGDAAYKRFGLDCYMSGKVMVDGHLEGTVCFASPEPRDRPFDADEHTFVRLLVEWISREIEREQLLETMAEQARRDSLTGLLNHGAFMVQLNEELDRVERYSHDLALLMIDLDHFKEINDKFGHPTGDKALKQVASLLEAETRSSDVVGRYGGEEFAMALPHSGLEDGRRLAERIAEGVRSCTVESDRGDVAITCSIGVTDTHEAQPDTDDLLKRADRALYQAKESGRNRVVTST